MKFGKLKFGKLKSGKWKFGKSNSGFWSRTNAISSKIWFFIIQIQDNQDSISWWWLQVETRVRAYFNSIMVHVTPYPQFWDLLPWMVTFRRIRIELSRVQKCSLFFIGGFHRMRRPLSTKLVNSYPTCINFSKMRRTKVQWKSLITNFREPEEKFVISGCSFYQVYRL